MFGVVLFHVSLLLSSDELKPFIEEVGSPGCTWSSAPLSGEPFLSFSLTYQAEAARQHRSLPTIPRFCVLSHVP